MFTRPAWLRSWRSALAVLVFAIAIGPFLAGEIAHASAYGHLAIGLHTDVVTESCEIGIPGVNTCYSLRGINLTPLPMRGSVCLVPNDTGPDAVFRYQIEKSPATGTQWQEVIGMRPTDCAGDFVRLQSQVLWPGVPVDLVTTEATAARGFHKGERFRFVVFTRFELSDRAWFQRRVASRETVLKQEVDADSWNIQFRVKH